MASSQYDTAADKLSIPVDIAPDSLLLQFTLSTQVTQHQSTVTIHSVYPGYKLKRERERGRGRERERERETGRGRERDRERGRERDRRRRIRRKKKTQADSTRGMRETLGTAILNNVKESEPVSCMSDTCLFKMCLESLKLTDFWVS